MEKVKCLHCESENASNAKYCFRCGYELPKVVTAILDEPVQQKVPNKKGLSIQGLIAIAIGFVIMSGVQYFFFKTPSFDKVMMEVASELNKTCPIMVDAETRLDNAIALPDNIFQFNYTLIHIDKASADTTGMKNQLLPTVTNFIKTSPQMQIQRDNKTTMNYFYKDKNGQSIFIISVTPDMYE